MKMNRKHILMIICVVLSAVILVGCNTPGSSKPAATEPPAPTAEEAPVSEDTTGQGDAAEEEIPLIVNPSAGEDSEEDSGEETPLIVNPNHSGMLAPDLTDVFNQTASLNFSGSRIDDPAQIVRPTASASGTDDGSVTIVNDHQVVYPENQTVIQRSVPSGQLQPLTYIPPTNLASGSSISFAAGATSAVISGYVPAGGVVSYNLYASANQNFLVLLTSDSGTSVLGITDGDVYGNRYNYFLTANQRKTSYNMYLPRTTYYYIDIYSGGYAENFTLQVFIPARVVIPTGRTSVSYDGTVAPYSIVSYTAYMYAGQTARIDDYSGARPTSFLRISGLQTGQIYMDYTAYSPSWYSVVPVTQDYLIEIISMDQPSNYRLTVDVR